MGLTGCESFSATLHRLPLAEIEAFCARRKGLAVLYEREYSTQAEQNRDEEDAQGHHAH